jgi:transglutaminase-like putative cysteine protease
VERVSWRLEITHVTHYHYDRAVVASYNEARVTPLDGEGQVVIDTRVAAEPAAAMFAYRDYWGTMVHAFDVHAPHQSLVVTAKAIVETATDTTADGVPLHGRANRAGRDGTVSWDYLAGHEVMDRFYEFLGPTDLVGTAELADVAASLRAASPTPAEAVPGVIAWAHDQLEYAPGATQVSTSAVEAWRAGRGVCQDFAHLSLAVLRAMGVPSRYVSGYFYPKADGTLGTRVVGESHAWVDAWTGKWSGHDPTNRLATGERHVVVARGRDYSDVAPLRGIYSGPPGSSAQVTVEFTRRA